MDHVCTVYFFNEFNPDKMARNPVTLQVLLIKINARFSYG